MSNDEKCYRPLMTREPTTPTYVQCVLLVIVVMVSFVAGCLFVLIIHPADSVHLQQQRDDLVYLIEWSKSVDWSRINDTVNNYDSLQRSKRQLGSASAVAGDSVKLVGEKETLLIETKGSGDRLVNKWQVETGFFKSGNYELIDNSYVQVKTDGVYFIYSQLAWTMKARTSVIYEIRNDGNLKSTEKPSKDKNTLAYCSQDKSDRGGRWKQCHTSVTTTLKSGDKIAIYIKKENFTVDFNPGKSFFGLTLLQPMPSS